MKQGGHLLLIAQNMNKQALKIVYGLNADQMQKTLKNVGSNKSLPEEASAISVKLPASKTAFMSRWNAKMKILDGLLEKKGGRPIGL